MESKEPRTLKSPDSTPSTPRRLSIAPFEHHLMIANTNLKFMTAKDSRSSTIVRKPTRELSIVSEKSTEDQRSASPSAFADRASRQFSLSFDRRSSSVSGRGSHRSSDGGKRVNYSKQDEDFLRTLNEHMYGRPTYEQWSRSSKATTMAFSRAQPEKPTSKSADKSKEASRRLIDKAKSEQQEKIRERVRILELRLMTRKQSLEKYHEREHELIEKNNELVKEIEGRERETSARVNDLLRTYEKCRIGASNLGQLLTKQKTECTENLVNLKHNLTTKITALEKWIDDYDNIVKIQQKELYDLQCYKDKEYHAKSIKISDLEKAIRDLDTENEDDYDDLGHIMTQELHKFEEELGFKRRWTYQACSGKALAKVHPTLLDMADSNEYMKKEITYQQNSLEMLSKITRELKIEVDSLKTLPTNDLRTIMFPELSIKPKCTPDMDLKLDIPTKKCLPI